MDDFTGMAFHGLADRPGRGRRRLCTMDRAGLAESAARASTPPGHRAGPGSPPPACSAGSAGQAHPRSTAYPLVRCRSPDDSPAMAAASPGIAVADRQASASRAAVNNDAGISTNCSPGGTSMPAFSALNAYPWTTKVPRSVR